ncbi:MAG: EthD domain-containing protein [bacterium]
MIITLGFIKRKPGLTHEEFSRHWRDVHGPLLRDTPEFARHLKRYVQHHIYPNHEFPELAPLEFDGFFESWFDSADARRQLLAEPLFKKLVLPDEAKFLDLSVRRTSMLDIQATQIGRDLVAEISGKKKRETKSP